MMKEVYRICVEKAKKHMEYMDADHPYEYRASKDGHYEREKRGCDVGNRWNWMASFVTGLAPLCYRTEKDAEYLFWANRCKKAYHDKMFLTPLESMHDIGFLYLPYSVAMYQLTGDPGHREDAIKAADELLKRFDIKGQYIDAWGRMDDDERVGRAIIDCMMNIALLFWAWKETGHTIYRDVAKAHADTTIHYFVREDYSVCHSFQFVRKTGEVWRELNSCGYSNGSHWARGTGWMVYGLAMMARYLQDFKYHELAVKIADKYLANLQGSYIPVWDFRLPEDMPALKCRNGGQDEPERDEKNPENCKYNVDTSAAAIMVCALQVLDEMEGSGRYRDVIEKTLQELCERYFNADPDTLGMLSHQDGCMTYTMYGDYYFMQGLQQYLYHTETCW